MPYKVPSPPRPPRGKETRLSSGIATNGPMVQREVDLMLERESAETAAAFGRAKHLANLLTLSYEPMFAWQWDGPIEFWNAGAERLYGFAPNDAVGRSSHTLLQTKFPVEFSELRSQLLNERYWSGELRHTTKDGHEVAVESRMQLLGDDTVLEANRDLTQIKALNIQQATLLRELRESEQRLRWLASIVKSSDDAIVSKSLDGIITSWNRGAERVFGYTAEEVIGQPITIVIPQDRQDEERVILTRTQTRRAYRAFRDCSATQAWQLNRRFTDRFSSQRCRRQDRWRIQDREGYYRAEAGPRADRHIGSGSRTPKYEFARNRTSSCQSFSLRHGRRSKTGN